MSKQILIPDIGTDEVTVTEIMVKAGDTITAEQSLITVEGDKASMEVPAPEAGVIQELLVKVGDMVTTGTPLLMLESDEQSAEASAPVAETQEPAQVEQPATPVQAAEPVASTAPQVAAGTRDVNVPDIGDDEVNVTEIMVKVGDSVEAEQSLITVEGDKASMEVPAPFAGTVSEIVVQLNDKVKTGSLIMRFVADSSAAAPEVAAPVDEKPAQPQQSAPAPQPAPQAAPAAVPAHTDTPVVNAEIADASTAKSFAHATPIIRALAREFGINLDKITGTGRKNRIVKEDIQNYVKNLVKQAEAGTLGSSSNMGFDLLPWPKLDFSKFGETEIKPIGKIQKISGANLHRNWVRIPHVTQWDNADITEVEKFRKEQNALAKKQQLDVKYTPLVFIMKAVAKALEVYPTFNSSLSADGASLIFKKFINLGIAVDTPNGLVVPVIKDVNTKTITELSVELGEVSKKARAGKLTGSDMQGGTFTISSLGGIGGTMFTPIINAPEVAILGVSKSTTTPVWNGTAFEPRLMLPLSLSYDHRVIDGALGARFITYLSSILADLRRILM